MALFQIFLSVENSKVNKKVYYGRSFCSLSKKWPQIGISHVLVWSFKNHIPERARYFDQKQISLIPHTEIILKPICEAIRRFLQINSDMELLLVPRATRRMKHRYSPATSEKNEETDAEKSFVCFLQFINDESHTTMKVIGPTFHAFYFTILNLTEQSRRKQIGKEQYSGLHIYRQKPAWSKAKVLKYVSKFHSTLRY